MHHDIFCDIEILSRVKNLIYHGCHNDRSKTWQSRTFFAHSQFQALLQPAVGTWCFVVRKDEALVILFALVRMLDVKASPEKNLLGSQFSSSEKKFKKLMIFVSLTL